MPPRFRLMTSKDLEARAALAENGVLDDGERDGLSEAFRVVTDVLLRRQIADFRAGRRVSYSTRARSASAIAPPCWTRRA